MTRTSVNEDNISTDTNPRDEQTIQQEIESLELSDPDLQTESHGTWRNSNAHEQNSFRIEISEKKELSLYGEKNLATTKPPIFHFVPLKMGGNGRTHVSTFESSLLLEEVGGLDSLLSMTDKFYTKVFADANIDKFIRSHDDPHGRRFATWIHQKLGGPGQLWDKDRSGRPNKPVQVAGGHHVTVHDRSSAHVAAWYSPKRPKSEVGRHFKLDECRIWMRLHFWAMREAGQPELSPSFVDYYVRFIGHFVRVYETTAPMFARDSYRWSADPANIQRYIANGNVMSDVLGLTFGGAMEQIPQDESEDFDWPYYEYVE